MSLASIFKMGAKTSPSLEGQNNDNAKITLNTVYAFVHKLSAMKNYQLCFSEHSVWQIYITNQWKYIKKTADLKLLACTTNH